MKRLQKPDSASEAGAESRWSGKNGGALKALRVRGPFKGMTGYDHVVRAMVRGLHARGVRIQLIDFPGWSPALLPEALRDPWFDSLSQPVSPDAVLHACMPHQARRARGVRNVNLTMFEASRVPEAWVKKNLRDDLVVVPTKSSVRVWVSGGYPRERIRNCPLGVDTEAFRPGLPPLDLDDGRGGRVGDHRVRFLNVSDLTPRKNLRGLVRTWLLATVRKDDAVLVLKLSCGSEALLTRFMQDLARMERDMGKTLNDAAPVVFLINRTFPDFEMPRLYASATHYWSLSRGEGWDLPMLEAAATGLELIAPAHSAYLDYLDEHVARLIPVRTVRADAREDRGLQAYFAGAEWWEPDEDDAASRISKAVGERGLDRGNAARELVEARYTLQQAADRLLHILNECMDLPRLNRGVSRASRMWRLRPFSRRTGNARKSPS